MAAASAVLYGLSLPLASVTDVLGYFRRLVQDQPALGVPWLLGYLFATNILVFGFFLVLAGLKEIPLKTSARARTGFRLKLLGANALALAFWLVVSDDQSGSTHWSYIAVPPAAWLGMTLGRRGFRYDAISAAEILSQDTRPPVVYLRSFRQDDDRLYPLWMRFIVFFVAMNFEQILAAILNPVGPFVAIGRPAEGVPELGAARMYFAGDEWREQIRAFMQRARLVVIRLGITDNVWWEVEQAVRGVDPCRLIVTVVESGKRREQMLARLGALVGQPLREPEGRFPSWVLRILNFGFRGYQPPLFLTFNSRWEPRFQRSKIRWSASMWEHPAWPAIEGALQPILRDMGLESRRRKSRATAFVLSLLFGCFGGHCFYLGQHRRGWTYLLLFWTTVPMFLALRDAWRITMITRAEFEARYPGFAAAKV